METRSLLGSDPIGPDDEEYVKEENPFAFSAEDFKPGTIGSKKVYPLLLTWKDVNCSLEKETGPICRKTKERKDILQGVSGFAKPGTLTAIIGSSGAGKSTLLDILSLRKNVGNLSGEILVNGAPRNGAFKRFSAYVTQEDILMATLTVKETLQFHVNLALERDPHDSSEERIAKREKRVAEMIHELGLEKTTNMRVGNEIERGISGGEKKRLSVGCEMISEPSLLFLDEPTTGLDAFNSQQVVYTLKKLAMSGRTILCTLHQPRSSIFAMFDYICCLSEGKVVYFGQAKEAVNYFATEVSEKCSSYFNPADFIIDLALEDERRRFALKNDREIPLKFNGKPISDGGGKLVGDSSLANVYEESSVHQKTLQEIEHVNGSESGEVIDLGMGAEVPETKMESFEMYNVSRFAVSWPYQLAYLLQRQWRNISRNSFTSIVVIVQATIMSLFVGSLFYNTLDDPDIQASLRVQNRMGALFFCMVNLSFSQMQSLLAFVNERSLFLKEKNAGLYRVSAYYIARTIVDVPSVFIAPLIFCTIAYWFIGFQSDVEKFFTFIAIFFVMINTMVSFFVFVGCLSQNPQVCQVIASLLTVIFFLFAGLFVSTDSIPDYYIWLQYLSPFKYAYAALLINEFEGLCLCQEINGRCPDVPACMGENLLFCDESPSDDVGSTGQSLCLVGTDSLENVWYNVLVLAGMLFTYRLLGYFALRFLYNQKR